MMILMIEIPTLETERLILRAPKFEDLEPMEGFFADPVRMKFLVTNYIISCEFVVQRFCNNDHAVYDKRNDKKYRKFKNAQKETPL